MTPQQALNVLNQATQPNARLMRADYVNVQNALLVIEELVKKSPDVGEPSKVEEEANGQPQEHTSETAQGSTRPTEQE